MNGSAILKQVQGKHEKNNNFSELSRGGQM